MSRPQTRRARAPRCACRASGRWVGKAGRGVGAPQWHHRCQTTDNQLPWARQQKVCLATSDRHAHERAIRPPLQSASEANPLGSRARRGARGRRRRRRGGGGDTTGRQGAASPRRGRRRRAAAAVAPSHRVARVARARGRVGFSRSRFASSVWRGTTRTYAPPHEEGHTKCLAVFEPHVLVTEIMPSSVPSSSELTANGVPERSTVTTLGRQ